MATALLALWNDVAPEHEAAYNDWHAREHVPERLTVPGIVWALRYARVSDASAMPRYLTLYGLRDAQVLDSAPYQRLLAEPTPASRAMRPALQRLARWVCRLEVPCGVERHGGHAALAVRTVAQSAPLPPLPDQGALLLAWRLPEAADLPWLGGGQASPVLGDRLEAWAHDVGQALPAEWAGAIAYARLPIGG